MNNLKNNLHYVNKNGRQLKDYMKMILTPEQYLAWCMGNVIKYTIRAGKKEGQSAEKDLGKRLDYLNEGIVFREEIGQPLEDFDIAQALLDLEEIKQEFEEWDGEEVEEL